MQFNELVNAIPTSQFIEVKTLGGKSSFFLGKDALGVYVISNGTAHKITKEKWDMTMARSRELPENEVNMSSRYTYGNRPFHWWSSKVGKTAPFIKAVYNHFKQAR